MRDSARERAPSRAPADAAADARRQRRRSYSTDDISAVSGALTDAALNEKTAAIVQMLSHEQLSSLVAAKLNDSSKAVMGEVLNWLYTRPPPAPEQDNLASASDLGDGCPPPPRIRRSAARTAWMVATSLAPKEGEQE